MNPPKSAGLAFLRLFGFARQPARTRFAKYARHSERALMAFGLIYLALLCFPQVLFAYNVTQKGITVYSRAPLPPETAQRVDEALALVNQSEIGTPNRSERIFVCNNHWLFRLFAPLSPRSFATSWPGTENIFIGDADLSANVAVSGAAQANRRSFSAVAAHELTHGLIRRRLGLFRAVRLPAWVAEGYCDYIAQESSYPTENGLRLMREGKEERSESFQYFVYRQMVKHLAQDRHYSFEQIVARAGERDAVKAETIRALKETTAP